MPRTISAAMQTHLSSGTTTLCWCYKVTRPSGVIMGFTDHDRNLVVDGVTYEALAGFSGSEIQESVGLAVDNQDIEGSLRSDRITEDDIVAGEYDGAEVIIYRVNWDNPTEKVLIKVGTIGEITRSDSFFKAEFRGLSHYLQQPQGRVFQYGCDVPLGSPRCGVNLASYTHTGSVTQLVDERVFVIGGTAAAQASDFYTRGKLIWNTGLNTGRAVEVKSHGNIGGTATIEIWQHAARLIVAGDTFTVSAGCDKQPKTCRYRYNNFINFQGFPYMPGADYTRAYVNKDDANQNGGSRGNIFA